MIHLGPHFPTFFNHNSSTNTDNIFSNKYHYLNCVCEPGDLTTSDHLRGLLTEETFDGNSAVTPVQLVPAVFLPVMFKLSTTPFITEKQKVYQTHKADWDLFQHKLESQVNVTNLDGNNIVQLENATMNWIHVVKKCNGHSYN